MARAGRGASHEEPRHGEFQALLLSSVLGMVLLAQAQNLVSFFVAIELLSVPLYVLCGSALRRRESLESGLKYLIVGSLGSATLLYGLAFIYGGSGSTDFGGIRTGIGTGLADDPLVLVGIGLAATGLAFKISIAPFHQWTPDVYQGAPTPVTAFMAVATKVAAFCVFVRFFEVALGPAVDNWQPALAVLAAVSIVVGNVGALGQDSLKRLLGYSGIAQAGYMLVGVVAASELGVNALIFYLAAYAFMNLAAFCVIVVRERETEFGDDIKAVQGLGSERPALAWPLTISMLALAGLPATAGFMAKLYLIEAAVEADYTWLAVAIAIGTMISLAYYLRVVAAVWMRPAVQPLGPEPAAGMPAMAGRLAGGRPVRSPARGRPNRTARHPLPCDPGPRRGALCGDDLLRRLPLPARRLGLERRRGSRRLYPLTISFGGLHSWGEADPGRSAFSNRGHSLAGRALPGHLLGDLSGHKWTDRLRRLERRLGGHGTLHRAPRRLRVAEADQRQQQRAKPLLVC